MSRRRAIAGLVLALASVHARGDGDRRPEPPADLPTVEQLLARADREWRPLRIRLDATMTCVDAGGSSVQSELTVRRDGERRSRIDFHGPPRDAGKVLLQLDDETWAYLPRARRVVELPRRRSPLPDGGFLDGLLPAPAELTGARVERGDEGLAIVLATRDRAAEAGRIVFDARTRLPVRREFSSRQGRPLKTLSVVATRPWGGRSIPWSVRFVDHVGAGRDCTLDVVEAHELPADAGDLFSRDALARGAPP